MLKSTPWKLWQSEPKQGGAMPKEMRQKGRNYYANCRFMGLVLQDCLGTSDERSARRRLEHLKALVERGEYQLHKRKIGELIHEYEEKVLPNKTKASQDRYKSIVKVHLDPFFAEHRLAGIEERVKEYLDSKSSLPESSLKKHARVLRDIIQLGDKNFELPAILYRNKGFYQKRFMTDDELQLIIGCMDERYHALALLLAHTGFRLSNAINLNWSDIRLGSNMIEVKQVKTGDFVKIPFTETVADVLRYRNRVRRIDGKVFDITVQAFQKAWKKAVKIAGIEWQPRPHDLRHYFCSYLLNKGVDHLTVATLSGHKDVNVLKERYGHYTDETLRKAMKVFDGCSQPVAK
jgi:integrase